MAHTTADIIGLFFAAILCGVLLVLPVLGAARMAGRDSAMARSDALIFGTSLLPAAINLVWTLLGRDATLVVLLGASAAGLSSRRFPGFLKVSRQEAVIAAVLLAVLGWAWLDLDWSGGLYMSAIAADGVKHAATVRVLAESGQVPPLDPFFARASPASYYYFFYLQPALVARLAGGLVDGRMAVAGQAVWTGLAFIAIAQRVIICSGLGRAPLNRGLLLALIAAGGVQIIPAAAWAALTGHWWLQVTWWSELVTSFLMSLVWVPHHFAALIAVWCGFLLIVEAIQQSELGAAASPVKRAAVPGIAALALASVAGLSLWIAIAAAFAIGLWAVTLLTAGRVRAVLLVAGIGLAALMIDGAYLYGVFANRSGAGTPIAFKLHPFVFSDVFFFGSFMEPILRVLLLPVSYLFDFGILCAGAVYAWRQRGSASASGPPRDVRRLLAISGLTGLVIATCLQSTVKNNDLGWRAVLLAQFAALVWTYHAFQSPSAAKTGKSIVRLAGGNLSAAAVALLLLGYVSNVYDLAHMRSRQWPAFMMPYAAKMPDAEVDGQLRDAYAWLATHVPPTAIVQHNPNVDHTYAYGLYGHSRVSVADHHNGSLFGASQESVDARAATIAPAFEGRTTTDDSLRRLRDLGIAAAVVTVFDTAWNDPKSWVWSQPALLVLPKVRVVEVGSGAGGIAYKEAQRP